MKGCKREQTLSTESACRMIGWQQESFRGTLAWFWRVTVLTFLQSENLLRRTGEASGCSSDSSKANRKSGGGGAPPQTSCNSKTIKFKRTKTFVLQALSKHDELLLTVSVVFWLQTPHQDGPLAVYHGPAQHINQSQERTVNHSLMTNQCSSLHEDILTLKLLPAWNKNTIKKYFPETWRSTHKVPATHQQHACNTTETHEQHVDNTLVIHLQHMLNTPTTHVQHDWNNPGTRLQHMLIKPPTCQQHPCNTPLTWLQHKWNTPVTWLKHPRNTPATRLKHAWNTPATHHLLAESVQYSLARKQCIYKALSGAVHLIH